MKIQLTADLEESDLARLFPDGDPFTRRCVISEIVGLLQSKLQDCKVSASIQAHEELGQAPATKPPAGTKPIADIRQELVKANSALASYSVTGWKEWSVIDRVQTHLINALADLEAHQAPAPSLPEPAAVPPKLTAAELLANADTKKAGEQDNGDTILEDMACPKCGCRGPFNIAGYALFEVESDTSSDIGDHTWEDSSPCICSDCQYGATVADFTFPDLDLLIHEPPQADIQSQIYRGELEATDADGIDTMGNQG